MLTNTSEHFMISNLGWVDGGGLWTFRVGEPRPRQVTLGNAKYLTLHAGTDDHFSVVHHDHKGPFWSDYALVRVDPIKGSVSLQQFDRYDDEYDKGYQGIVGVTEIPDDSLLLVAVQRASRLVLYDPIARARRGLIELAARGGNPSLFFRRRANELWAVDLDNLKTRFHCRTGRQPLQAVVVW